MKSKNFRTHFVALAVVMTMFAAMGAQAHAANFKITSAVMAKKYTGGKASGITSTFKTSDRTIYCVLKTDRILKNVKVRFKWSAVNVSGLSANTVFLDKSGVMARANILWGSAALKRNWPAGTYRVEVFVNGSKVKTMGYSIR